MLGVISTAPRTVYETLTMQVVHSFCDLADPQKAPSQRRANTIATITIVPKWLDDVPACVHKITATREKSEVSAVGSNPQKQYFDTKCQGFSPFKAPVISELCDQKVSAFRQYNIDQKAISRQTYSHERPRANSSDPRPVLNVAATNIKVLVYAVKRHNVFVPELHQDSQLFRKFLSTYTTRHKPNGEECVLVCKKESSA